MRLLVKSNFWKFWQKNTGIGAMLVRIIGMSNLLFWHTTASQSKSYTRLLSRMVASIGGRYETHRSVYHCATRVWHLWRLESHASRRIYWTRAIWKYVFCLRTGWTSPLAKRETRNCPLR